MHRTNVALVLVLLAVILSANRRAALAEDLAPSPYVAWGKSIYEQRCASCHGSDGKGHGVVAPALKTAPADLTELAEKNGGTFPRAKVLETTDGRAAVAAHGARKMPVWGRVFEDEVAGPYGAAAARAEIQALADAIESMQAR
jgi:mono/diheme cytochrome c family protein